MRTDYCKNCASLVEGENHEWICDEVEKPIGDVEFCKEWIDDDRLQLKYTRSTYAVDGSLAIQAWEFNEEWEVYEPYCTVSVNLIEQGLQPQKNCIFIPLYKMSEKLYRTICVDIVKDIKRVVSIGLGMGVEVELIDGWEEKIPKTI